jgi:hypothetical protein
MAADLEWTEWHLTSHGWIAGTENTGTSLVQRPVPESRVLSLQYIEEHSGYGRPSARWQEQWRSSDPVLIATLIAEFGSRPQV